MTSPTSISFSLVKMRLHTEIQLSSLPASTFFGGIVIVVVIVVIVTG